MRVGYQTQTCASDRQELIAALAPKPADVFLLDGTSSRLAPAGFRELLEIECPHHESSILWLITEDGAAQLDPAGGADDFLVLPSSVHELLARVRLLLWRTQRLNAEDVIQAGPVVVDHANYAISVNGRPLELTFKEFELLKFLVAHRGRVFTREALLNQVWGYDYYGGTRTVDVHIRRIRAKLGPEHEDLVETLRNVGYRFNL
jgi:DNA-binding response OmpR family regulator